MGSSMFVRGDATLWGMGDNFLGELGNGNNLTTNVPELTPGLIVASISGMGDAERFLAVAAALPQVSPVAYVRFGSAGLLIPISQLLTNAVDPDGGALTLASVTTSTNGVTLTSSNGCLLYQSPGPAADQFSYTVTDAFGGTGSGVVNIVPASTLAGQVQSIALASGAVGLTFGASPGWSYDVQRATNLVGPWATLCTTNVPPGAAFSVLDPNPPQPAAFYRLMLHAAP
jgi:hypothetical protein